MKKTFALLIYKLYELKILLGEFYENFSSSDVVYNNYALKNTVRILTLQEQKHVNFYRQRVKESEAGEEYIIDDEIFSQFEFQIINLKQSLSTYGIRSAGQLIAKAIDIQNKQIFLITSIKEALKPDSSSLMGYILDALLDEERKYLTNLLPFHKLS